MAIAHSPIRRSLEVPSGATGRLPASILSTARSLIWSAPSTFAGYVVPSRMATSTVCAPLTTCALVTMTPSPRITNPEPSPGRMRVPEPRPKNASNGSTAACCTLSVCTVTTLGATRATASVMTVRRAAGTLATCAAFAGGTSPSSSRSRPQPAARSRSASDRRRTIRRPLSPSRAGDSSREGTGRARDP